ncbi:MAG: MBL fold metallo-hydrolase [Clostridia bacterium]|nr:MBL fold metallo-hydrolase [Clostridia bacterium]
MQITVLTENTTAHSHLFSEHGLSLYIETENHRILFDTGQSDAFYKNAVKLGIDLTKVDILIISHGHYDHGGGLKRFLETNSKAEIYLSPHAFENHYSKNGYIGLDRTLSGNERFTCVSAPLHIDNLTLFPASLLPAPFDVDHSSLTLDSNIPDNFDHEQYLLIKENNRKILISGCSHKGILNIAHFFNPDVLIGGFHFMKINIDEKGLQRLTESAKALLSYNCTYYTCHCTGQAQFEVLKEIMNDKLNYISTGDSFTA